MTDFASGFRAGVLAARQVAIDNARSLTGTGQGMAVDIAEEIALLEPPQQPDAAPSDFVATMREIRSELTAAGITVDAAAFARERNPDPAVAAWRALSAGKRNEFICEVLRYMMSFGSSWQNTAHIAAELLRSLAPEAGDADGGKEPHAHR